MVKEVGSERFRKTACLAQVLLVSQHATLGLALAIKRYRLGRDHRLKAQEIDEMPERGPHQGEAVRDRCGIADTALDARS